MNFLKNLWLAALVAAGLAVLAAPASAATVTSPEGTTYTSTIKAESEGAMSGDGAFVTVTCNKSTVEMKIEKHGSGVTAGGNVSKLTFNECNYPVEVKKAGSVEFHAGGAVTSSGAEASVQTSVGTCVFTTNQTGVGTGTSTKSTGGHATLDLASSKIPRTGGSFLCGSSGTVTGSYTVTSPSTLFLD